uniref:SCP domain-containing protein n=1 Tax=Meloidogyne hapla TaxID=6305 RepID=A0A1I8B1R2_MELHA
MLKKYASTFVKQRIQPHLLRDLVQLAIIRYINYCDGNPPEFAPPPKKAPPPVRTVHRNDAYVDDDDVVMLEEEDVYSPTKPILSTAPDRHDIYHIKMPTGESNSKRAKNILEVHNSLREQGVIKRGVTGVRRSGIDLHSVSSRSKPMQKQSPLKAKPTAALVVQDTDITSSTAAGWLPTRSLRSDAISTKTMVVKDAASNQTLIGRGMIANRTTPSKLTGNKIPVRVNLGNEIAAALKAPLRSPIKRQTVQYEEDDGMLDIGEHEDFMEESLFDVVPTRKIPKVIQRRPPIAERIQLVRKQVGVGQRNQRPVITLDGRKLNLSGGGRKTNIGKGGKKGISILQRISF